MAQSVQQEGSTIWLPNDVKDRLDKLKIHPRESYYSVVSRLLVRMDEHVGLIKK